MKKRMTVIAVILVVISLAFVGCGPTDQNSYDGYQRYSDTFFDTFDTLIQVMAYTQSEEEFQQYFDQIRDRFKQLHQYYDIYNNYPDINNVKTINDQAGIAPVKVPKEVMDLVLFALEWHDKTAGKTNIAMGPVLRIWSDYRADAEFDPALAAIPSMEELEAASVYTDINEIVVDEEAGTIFLPDPNMSLDVGAVAKGFATELVVQEMKAQGLESLIISAGGNVRAVGRPFDQDRETWTVGLHNPDELMFADGNSLLGTVSVNDASVVSSGDYQRYYMVGDTRVHHIIDSDTYMPASHYRAITVVIEDSGIADYLSTELFLLPLEESKALAQEIEGLKVIWVLQDGTIETTDGLEDILNRY